MGEYLQKRVIDLPQPERKTQKRRVHIPFPAVSPYSVWALMAWLMLGVGVVRPAAAAVFTIDDGGSPHEL